MADSGTPMFHIIYNWFYKQIEDSGTTIFHIVFNKIFVSLH